MVLRRRKPDPFFVADAMAREVEGVATVVGDIAVVGLDAPGSERVVAALLELRAVVGAVINGQVLK